MTKISIHVLRVEDDQVSGYPSTRGAYFNPRPPCGGRPRRLQYEILQREFQSTSSVWRTTPTPYKRGRPPRCISIHVLRVEDDLQGFVRHLVVVQFQSTSSVWRTT